MARAVTFCPVKSWLPFPGQILGLQRRRLSSSSLSAPQDCAHHSDGGRRGQTPCRALGRHRVKCRPEKRSVHLCGACSQRGCEGQGPRLRGPVRHDYRIVEPVLAPSSVLPATSGGEGCLDDAGEPNQLVSTRKKREIAPVPHKSARANRTLDRRRRASSSPSSQWWSLSPLHCSASTWLRLDRGGSCLQVRPVETLALRLRTRVADGSRAIVSSRQDSSSSPSQPSCSGSCITSRAVFLSSSSVLLCAVSRRVAPHSCSLRRLCPKLHVFDVKTRSGR